VSVEQLSLALEESIQQHARRNPKPSEYECVVHTVPGIRAVRLRVWCEKDFVCADVLAIDGTPCVPLLHLRWDSEHEYDGIVWRETDPAGAMEVVALDSEGTPVYQAVNPTACWYMDCPRCGRRRYAIARARHQIKYCHVCYRQLRAAKRSAAAHLARKNEVKGVRVVLPSAVWEKLKRLGDPRRVLVELAKKAASDL
jgi:hypothetical protein